MSKSYSSIKAKYIDKVPVIVKCDFISRKKYLVPRDFTISQLVMYLRKSMNLKASEAIYIFINNTIPRTCDYVNTYENGDFVYVTIKKENTFG